MGIEEFYRGKGVLLTGATGHVGSVLAERLLSSCPSLGRLLLLVRQRAGQTPEERVAALLRKKLFCRLSEEAKAKLCVVEGDVSQPGLGLSPADLDMVRREVAVVFHAAATINFSAPLDRSVAINLRGTAEVLDLARSLPGLQALVHVSTAFANCMNKTETIQEKIYFTKWNPRDLLEMSPEYIRQHEKEFVGEQPNTYSFTKQLSEVLIATEGTDLPVVIARPSMVLCTAEEPLPGWMENVQTGTFGFIAGAGRGVFRTIRVNPDVHGDWVPVDYFAAFLIAAAWRAHQTGGLEVYHYTCGLENRLLWSELVSGVMASLHRNPTENAVLYPSAKCRPGRLRDWLVVVLFHYLPAALLDTLGQVADAPAKVLEVQKKYARGSGYAAHFTLHDWRFCNEKVRRLWLLLGEEEQRRFRFSMDGFDWPAFLETCVLGVREHYHRQGPDSLPAARTRHRRLKVAYVFSWVTFIFILYQLFNSYCASATSFSFSLAIALLFYWL